MIVIMRIWWRVVLTIVLESDHYDGYKGVATSSRTSVAASTGSDDTEFVQEGLVS